MAARTDKKTALSELTLVSQPRKLGLGYRIQFIMCAGELRVVWTPCLPTGRDNRRLADKYRTARAEFLSEVARRTGANIACVELPA